MNIVIPTSGRANKQTTLSYLYEVRKDVQLLVYPEEYLAYEKHGVPIIVCDRHGIANKRQFIIDNFDRVIMLDDDLTFAVRREDEPTKFRPATFGDVADAMGELWNYLNSLAHIGMAGREGANRNTADYLDNIRAMRVHAWDCKYIRAEKIRADDVDFMFDFHVTLSMLERGYPNRLLNWIVHDQKGSNSEGGCSQYRTKERLAMAAHRLKELHPNYVNVVTKQTKTAWGGGERTDVTVSWKRALADSVLLDPRAGTGPG